MEKNLELNNNLEINNKNNIVTSEDQKNFLETDLGKTINEGINLGLKKILPDFIEDEVIEIKDNLLTDGFSATVKTEINKAIDFGKNIIGIFNGNFENISQIKESIEKSGVVSKISDLLDKGINKLETSGKIGDGVSTLLKNGKKIIENIINNNIENDFDDQIKSIENIDKNIENWNTYFEKQDFTKMEKQYTKIEKELEKIVPLENIIKKARIVENLHNLIKNNGKNFNLSKEELELANELI